MDPLTIGLIGGSVLGPIAGGIIGNSAASGHYENEKLIIQQMMDELKKVGIPSQDAQKIVLERFQSAGKLTPELEQDILQQDSSLSGYHGDPELKAAQTAALGKLQQIGDSGGLLLEDQANLNRIIDRTNAEAAGQRNAALQHLAQQGRSGSGFELAASLLGGQQQAQLASQQGMDIAAQAQKRALDAIMSKGQLAGNVRSQDFGEAKDVAAAEDAINRFNTLGRQGVQERNVAANNAAQAQNLAQQQAIMNANTGLQHQEEIQHKSLPQQQFQNEMQKANAYAGALGAEAKNESDAAQRAANMWGGVGQGVGQIAGNLALGNMLLEEKKKKAMGTVGDIASPDFSTGDAWLGRN